MRKIIILDSGPLGLILQRPGYSKGQGCWEWMQRHLVSGVKVFVPEIVHYELRRELLRINQLASLKALEIFLNTVPDRLILINSAAMLVAAELWAKARQQGTPTADPHALDVDVILSAQVLTSGFNQADVIVATSNVKHLSLFVPAAEWATI